MSINITVHGSPKNSSRRTNILIDREHAKKKEFDERRRLRLEQVRQKSKEIASQLRHKVELEKKKQLERIDKIKKDELLKWREKAVSQMQNNYQRSLEDVGIAHKAAEMEPEKLQPCITTLRSGISKFKTTTSPGKLKTRKVIATTVMSPKTSMRKQHTKTMSTLHQTKHPKQSIKSRNKVVSDENSSGSANITSKHDKISTDSRVNEISDESVDEEGLPSSKSVTAAAKIQKSRKTSDKSKIVQTPSIIMEISSCNDDDSLSSVDIEDVHDSSNMHYSRITSKYKSSPRRSSPKKRRHREFISSVLEKSTRQPTRFTQISDLIRQKSQSQLNIDKQPLPEKTMHLTRSTSASPPTRKYTDRSPLGSPQRKSVMSTPTSPRKRQIQSSQFSVKEIEREGFKNVGVNTTSPRKSIGCQAPSILSKKNEKSSLKSSMKSSDPLYKQQQQSNGGGGGGSRVQFYDYNNKFEKFYEPPGVVIQNERIPCGLNAMEQAEIETELQKDKEKELELNRMKSDERCQRALEREKVRRDYETLTAKLDAIKDKFTENPYFYSSVRIKNAEEQKQKTLNSEVEKVLKRPTIITCPEIKNDRVKNDAALHKHHLSDDLNLCSDNGALEQDTLNTSTSDSCASILLNYISDQTKKVSEDIANCDSMQKMKQLQSLLDKVNNLRNQLLIELRNYKNMPYNKEHVQKIVDSIDSVDKQREQIMGKQRIQKDKTESLKNVEEKIKDAVTEEGLERKRKELNKKEALIEKKLRNLYKISKIHEKESQLKASPSPMETTDSEDLTSERIVTQKPIEIVIRVQNKTHTDHRRAPVKSPFKISRKRPSLTSMGRKKKKREHLLKSTPIQQDLPSTIKDNFRTPVPLNITQQEDGTTITSYRSPPEEIPTTLTPVLDARRNTVAQNLQQKTPIGIKNKERIQKLYTVSKNDSKSQSKNEMNPHLQHYIQRLLGMSHHAVEMLGVSTSEIETPSSSIINISANVSTASKSSDSFETAKIERLKKFIQDNYKFLEEVDESMKKDTSTISSSSNAVKTIENIWKQMLTQKEKDKKQIKPILKKEKSPKKKKYRSPSSVTAVVSDATEKAISSIERSKSPLLPAASPPKEKNKLSSDLKDSSRDQEKKDSKKLQLLGKYNDLAEHCTQRIAELNEMINKVREEKQKILEITLSSAGDTARTSTEYVDFYDNNAHDRSGSSKVSDKKITSPLTRSPEKVPLEKHKLTGMSRDSGISLSRPVTALDSRESPEIPSSMQEDFEPILKDIPKPSTAPLIDQIIPSISLAGPVIDSITTATTIKSRKEKPPASLDRYSPQLGEELNLQPAHELSTIAEVDTPGTSRLNTSATTERQQEKPTTTENVLEIVKIQDRIVYQRFPSFHEYARQNNLDLTVFDENTVSQIQVEYEEMVNRIENIEHGKMEDLSREIRSLVDSLRLFNLSFKKFPTRKEYLEQIGISDSMDSKSIDDATYSTKTVNGEHILQLKNAADKENIGTDSTESLLDVVNELKRRNMLQSSFNNEIPARATEDKSSESENLVETTSSSDHHQKSKPTKSPKKKQSKEEQHDAISGIEMMPPTTASSHSHSDDIEKDLEKMGLTWAAAMLKKSQENRKDFASTSSSSLRTLPKKISSPRKSKSNFEDISNTIRQELSDMMTSDSSDLSMAGRPLNLKEFLANELKKRTLTPISTSSDGSSLTSKFLQSLLESSGSRSSSKRSDTRDGKSTERVKTSTPVNTRSSSISPKLSHLSNGGGHSSFFSGDSRPSSVRYTSSSTHSDENKNLNDKINDKAQSS